jgi:CubicO group peptidase (beta-lactamase class C family)
MAGVIGDTVSQPRLPGIGEAMQAAVDAREIAGAVTVVVSKDKVLHLQTNGWADIATQKPMQADSLFWIASMTKPITATAVLMLQDDGKLDVTDPVAKYIPAFADLKTPSGKPANLTIMQILTHTSGLGEVPADQASKARTLADMVPLWLAAPMQYEPGAKWQYTQSGINLAGRIVEVVSGMSFDAFVQQRIFDPLGMKSTTFYPAQGSLVTAYAKNQGTGSLDATPSRVGFGVRGRPPFGNGGLYSTGPDYARFCQMLLGGGELDGKRYLSPTAMKWLSAVQTGELPCGFFQSAQFGNHGANYGWGLGTCILRTPHEGVAAMLSPGTFGHGGAWGTQAWIDPARGVAYVLMVQRSNFPNSDASDVRRAFQQAAAASLPKQSRHSPTTKYPSYDGLMMAGYQGWFRLGRDGRMYPDETRVRIDMWPDVSEYEKTYPTGLKLADGSTARFFNSADQSTVNLHFKWMKEYGLDGVFMQRFFGATRPNARQGHEMDVLRFAFQAASENERAIAVMYDLSGLRDSGEDVMRIADDWKFLVDTLKVTDQPGVKTYLHHRGGPLVVIWGVGFPDRGYDIKNIALDKLIDFFHDDPEYGGCSVMLGVPTYWRDLNADCRPEPYLHELIKRADLVMPWTVQRYSPLLHNEMWRYRDMVKADMKWCRENGVDYVPCVYPGFSWHNLSRFEFPDDIKPVGSIPRQSGRFYWQLISTAIDAGADKLYVAMFDEVNEGTAIFKCTDNPPVSSVAQFIGMDGKPSDHYLWLTGQAARMLRKEKPFSEQMPVRN